MKNIIKKICEKYLVYYLKKNGYENLEAIITIDGCDYYLRNKELERKRKKPYGI